MLDANMRNTVWLLLVFFSPALGCNNSPAQPTPSNLEKLRAEISQSEKAAAKRPLPKLVIELPTIAGWQHFEPKPLPIDDDGLSIAFEHEDGITVTFYQYTRGMKTIPTGTSTVTATELQRARNGIKEMISLKLWDNAVEEETEETSVGTSELQAAWSRYQLTKDQQELVSDIYVWGSRNRIFKVRATGDATQLEAYETALQTLLTALGKACVAVATK